MRRREFILCAAGLDKLKRVPPNILFIMPDQWRGQDLGSMGNTQIRTPNLDRLAGEGVQFTKMMANCPVCTPARGILLTGKYAHTTGTAVNDVPLPDQEVTIAEILAERGYFTGFVGKWHLEGGKRMPGFVPPGPRRQGFQFWAANICSHNYLQQTYFRDDPAPIRIPGYDTIGWTDLAIEFLEKAQGRKQPFCLYVEYPTPHDREGHRRLLRRHRVPGSGDRTVARQAR
jgi:arylsulfatase A-like enzyme